jgi:hypothetical protein
VAVAVVDALEVVQVDQCHARLWRLGVAGPQFDLQAIEHRAAVQQPGQVDALAFQPRPQGAQAPRQHGHRAHHDAGKDEVQRFDAAGGAQGRSAP